MIWYNADTMDRNFREQVCSWLTERHRDTERL